MAKVSVQVPNSNWSLNTAATNPLLAWVPPRNNRVAFGPNPITKNIQIFLAYLLGPYQRSLTAFTFRLAPDQITEPSFTGPDLSDDWETNGDMTFTATDGSSVTISFSHDRTEPYTYQTSRANYTALRNFWTNLAGLSDRSLTITFDDGNNVAPSRPDAPELLERTTNALRVSFAAPVDGGSAITHYNLRHKISTEAIWIESVIPDLTLLATIGGLRPNTAYEIQIQAVNRVGSSPWSLSLTARTAEASTVSNAPNAPDAPMLDVVNNNSVSVVWAHSNNGGSLTTAYEVEYKKSSDIVWTSQPHEGLIRTAIILNLEKQVTYQVRVRARNAVGVSEWSPPGSIFIVAPNEVPDLGVFTAGQIVLETEPNKIRAWLRYLTGLGGEFKVFAPMGLHQMTTAERNALRTGSGTTGDPYVYPAVAVMIYNKDTNQVQVHKGNGIWSNL